MPVLPNLRPARPSARVLLALALLSACFATLGPTWSGAARAVASASKDDQADEVRRVANTDGAGLRVRKEPGLEADVVSRLPEGALVRLREEKSVEEDGERWVAVRMTEGKGWVASRFLARASTGTPLKPEVRSDAPFAERVVAIARSAHGQPYVWAGNAPGGFDCSGFVQWVYTQAGVKMARLIPDQLEMGKKVDRDDLRPGDLVTFVNTYKDGLSHVGIYLGNDLFQHASDEAHGVTVSRLSDPYWEQRYYRAVRIK